MFSCFQRLTHDNTGSKMEAILETAYHTSQKTEAYILA